MKKIVDYHYLASNIFLYSINEIPSSVAPLPSSQVVCQNNSVECLVGSATDAIGEYTFEWFEQGEPTIPLKTESNTTTSTFCPPSNVLGTFIYYYVITTDAGCSSLPSDSAQVVINSGPSIESPPSNQVLCNGEATSIVEFTSQNTVGTTSYSWTNSNTSIGLPSSGVGNISSFTATNLSTQPRDF